MLGDVIEKFEYFLTQVFAPTKKLKLICDDHFEF